MRRRRASIKVLQCHAVALDDEDDNEDGDDDDDDDYGQADVDGLSGTRMSTATRARDGDSSVVWCGKHSHRPTHHRGGHYIWDGRTVHVNNS